MTITRLHISVTVLIALALHGGIAMWLTLPTPAPPPEPPLQPFRISLLAAVAETTVNAPVAAPEPPPEPVVEPTPTPPPPPEPEPEPEPKPVPKPEPVPKPKPKPVPKPKAQEAPPEPEPPEEPIPEPAPPQPVESVPEPVETPKPVQKTVPPPSAEPSSTPLDAVATAKYEQLLVAWLEKHKKYPRRAKRLRIEGEGLLRILIDRTGQIKDVTLEQRTGNRLLDRAALEMARRADPFPPMPAHDPRQALEFIIPVMFTLR